MRKQRLTVYIQEGRAVITYNKSYFGCVLRNNLNNFTNINSAFEVIYLREFINKQRP